MRILFITILMATILPCHASEKQWYIADWTCANCDKNGRWSTGEANNRIWISTPVYSDNSYCVEKAFMNKVNYWPNFALKFETRGKAHRDRDDRIARLKREGWIIHNVYIPLYYCEE